MGSRSRSRSRSRRSSRGRSASRSRRGSSRGSSRTSRRSRRSGSRRSRSRRSGSYRTRTGSRSGSRSGSYRSRSRRSGRSGRRSGRSQSSRGSTRTVDSVMRRDNLKRRAKRYHKRVVRRRDKYIQHIIDKKAKVDLAGNRESGYLIYKLVMFLLQLVCMGATLLVLMEVRNYDEFHLNFYAFDILVNAIFFVMLAFTAMCDCAFSLLILPFLTMLLCVFSALHLLSELFFQTGMDLRNLSSACDDNSEFYLEKCIIFGILPRRLHIVYVTIYELGLHVMFLFLATFGMCIYEGTVQHTKQYDKLLFSNHSPYKPSDRVIKLAKHYNRKLKRAKKRLIAKEEAAAKTRTTETDGSDERDGVQSSQQSYRSSTPYYGGEEQYY